MKINYPLNHLTPSRPWCTFHNWSNFASHLPDDDVLIIIIIIIMIIVVVIINIFIVTLMVTIMTLCRPWSTLQVCLISISLTLDDWDTGDDSDYHYNHHDFDMNDIDR